MSDKNRAILTVGMAIVILAVIFLYQGVTHHNALVQQAIDQEEKSFHGQITALEKYSFTPYIPRIANLLQMNQTMVTAFASRDRGILYSTTLPVYEALSRENPYFKVMHFHLPDGTTFLRMHNPDFFGDNLRHVRPIIDAVTESGKPQSGFEMGRHGPFYRIAHPVFVENNLVGVLEFGIKAHQILEAAQIDLDSRGASYFLETEWQKVDHEAQHFQMRQFGQFTLNTHNDPLFTSLPPEIDLNSPSSHLELEGKNYILHVHPVFQDHLQKVHGGIVILQDITRLVQQKNRFVAQMSGLVFLLTALCLSVLYISFNNLVRILEKSKKRLKASVDALSTEVTERQKAERRAREAQNEWEKTFNVMGDIITIQDRNMEIVRANRAAYDFFEVKQGELEGRKCYEVFRGRPEPCPKCPGIDALQDIENHSEIIEHEDLGKIFQVSSAPLLNGDNKVRYLVHVARDITDQKKMEAELFQAHKMEAIGTLAGGIAHDFNNILTAVLGYGELGLMACKEGKNPRENIDEIIKAGNRAKNLVAQILAFSRQSEHDAQVVSVEHIVKEALKLLRASLPTSLEIKTEISDKPSNVLADPTQIHQIIVNLCTNSLHAMDNETGVLTVSLGCRQLGAEDLADQKEVEPGHFVELAISDTGHGIDAATLKRIFEPYFTTKERGRGTGLGLALVHGAVNDCHGVIRVESKVGVGTTFRVFLPLVDRAMTEGESRDDLRRGTEKILVVDDEEAIVSLYKKLLSSLGYTVAGTTSSQEALEIIRRNPQDFDLVITDQTMPGLTGINLAQKMLTHRPDLPIIICTGYSSTLSEEKAMAAGVRSYLEKPVNKEMLTQAIRQIFDN